MPDSLNQQPGEPILMRKPVNTRSRVRIFTVVSCALLVAMSGCGPKTPKNAVSGEVTLNQQPVLGVVEFIGEDGKSELAPISNGKYVTYTLKPGQFKVVVKDPAGSAGGGPAVVKKTNVPVPPGMEGAKASVTPPRKYSDPNQSGLVFDFSGGQQTFDIPLNP
jgi:hypothetical protein